LATSTNPWLWRVRGFLFLWAHKRLRCAK
jgi:hypothetical protein